MTATAATIHSAITRHGCRTAARPSQANTPSPFPFFPGRVALWLRTMPLISPSVGILGIRCGHHATGYPIRVATSLRHLWSCPERGSVAGAGGLADGPDAPALTGQVRPEPVGAALAQVELPPPLHAGGRPGGGAPPGTPLGPPRAGPAPPGSARTPPPLFFRRR